MRPSTESAKAAANCFTLAVEWFLIFRNACLVKNGFIASEILFHQLDLEGYFMSLMGGVQNA